MICSDLDLGAHPTWAAPLGTNKWPESNQNVDTTLIDGTHEIVHVRGRQGITRTETVYVRATSSIGGAPVGAVPQGTVSSTQYLLSQFMELAGNRNLQPVFIQWRSGGGVIVTDPQDGWYFIAKAVPDNEYVWAAEIPVDITVVKAAPPPPARLGMGFTGGAVATTYGGAATNWVGVPINATTLSPTNRPGAQGNIPVVMAPAVNPVPWVPGATLADMFKGGCQVFDVNAAIATNPVPTNGTFVHANWVEVKGTEHRFVGDIVLTNGLVLFVFSIGSTNLWTMYGWIAGAWQQANTLQSQDNAGNTATLRDLTLTRLGLEWMSFDMTVSTSAGNATYNRWRLARGAYAPWHDLVPESQANTSANSLQLTLPSAAKILFSDTGVKDNAVESGVVTQSGNYGYGAALIANSSYPFLTGFLYQNPPAGQPQCNGSSSTALGLGDTSGPGQSFGRTYGVFVVPYPTPQNAQAEAEGGTLDAGWSSTADSGASAANAAKAASGTVTGRADLFGTAWQPPGQGNLWYRVRVTSAAGSASEMKLGLWDTVAAAYVTSQTYKANQAPTAYGPSSWLLVASNVTPPAGHNVRFKAETTATLGTDWFIDEALFLPTTDPVNLNLPQDIDQQMRYDRTTRIALS